MATATLTLGPRDQGRAMTLDEYEAADFEGGFRYELDQGVLDVTKVPSTRHRQVCWDLGKCFFGYDSTYPGTILCAGGGSEFQFVIPEFVSGRIPTSRSCSGPERAAARRTLAPRWRSKWFRGGRGAATMC